MLRPLEIRANILRIQPPQHERSESSFDDEDNLQNPVMSRKAEKIQDRRSRCDQHENPCPVPSAPVVPQDYVADRNKDQTEDELKLKQPRTWISERKASQIHEAHRHEGWP